MMAELPNFPLPSVLQTAGAHRLQHSWAMWTQKKVKKTPGGSWYDGTQCIGRFNTVEGFWQIYSHMVRADHLNGSIDVMVFHDGIKPFWEDESNKYGGRWTLRCRKHGAAVVWEETLLALIGEQSDVGNEICGAVLSVRYHDDHISVWNRSADNEPAVAGIRDLLVRTLGLPASVPFDYNRHKHYDKAKEKGSGHGPLDADAGGHSHVHSSSESAGPQQHHPGPAGAQHYGQGQSQGGSGWRSSSGPGPLSPQGMRAPYPSYEPSITAPARNTMDAVPLTLRRTAPAAAATTAGAGSSQSASVPVASAGAISTQEVTPDPAPTGASPSPWAKPAAWPPSEQGPWSGSAAEPLPGQAVSPVAPVPAPVPATNTLRPFGGERYPHFGPSTGDSVPPLPSGAPPMPTPPMHSSALDFNAKRPAVYGGPRPSGMAARGRPQMGQVREQAQGGTGVEDDGWQTVPAKK